MAIVSSSITEDFRQVDGRRQVTESHLDSTGQWHRISYVAPADMDVQTRMAARVSEVEAMLREAEILENVTNLPPLAQMRFNFSTQADNLAVLRTFFQASRGVEAAKKAAWIFENLTLAQIRTAFGLTGAQATALQGRLQTIREHYVAILAAAGE